MSRIDEIKNACKYLQISENEKAKILDQKGNSVCFKLENLDVMIKDNQNNSNELFSTLIQIETSQKLNNTDIEEDTILEKITQFNLEEPFGVFLYNPSDNEITFRTVNHCNPQKYLNFISETLTRDPHGHKEVFKRFMDSLN